MGGNGITVALDTYDNGGGEAPAIGVKFAGIEFASTNLAKAALVNLTRTVAQEWAARRVRVNALAPGWIETDLNVRAREGLPGFMERATASIPMGRWGRQEEVAAAALFVATLPPQASVPELVIKPTSQTYI